MVDCIYVLQWFRAALRPLPHKISGYGLLSSLYHDLSQIILCFH